MVFAFRDSRGSVEVAFTDRHGGVSGAPYASLNLSVPPTDAHGDLGARRREAEANLDIVAQALADRRGTDGHPLAPRSDRTPPRVVAMHQVHGADVHTVDRAWLESGDRQPPVADGLVTDQPGVALLVRVADCVPVLLADAERGVVGAAHAGRQGLVVGVVPATVARMRELGAVRLEAWIGPHICGGCYEVPAEMREQVAAVAPASRAETSWGTPAVDVGAGVRAQLRADGVEVHDVSGCTLEDDDLYSYRRDGVASGRFGGLVWVRP